MQVDATESRLHVSPVESTKRDVIMVYLSATVVSKEISKTAVFIIQHPSPNLATRPTTRALGNPGL
jgi:hypothetical protein